MGTLGRRPPLRERVLLSLARRYEPASASDLAKALRAPPTSVMRALAVLAADERIVCVAKAERRRGTRWGRSPALWVAL
jgi:predicted ArsR family transcriptional regulator